MNRGNFIVIDGIDGSGKGTAAKRLAGAIYDANKNNHVVLTREPFISKYITELRELLKITKNPKEKGAEFTRLFVSDRKVHAEIIESQLASGLQVVCDRYKYSTLAYQWAQGMALEELIKMHANILVPDIVLILDLPAKLAMQRVGADLTRPYHEVFEQEKFQESLRHNFLELPKRLPNEHIVIIDGSGTPDQVFAKVWSEVASLFQKL